MIASKPEWKHSKLGECFKIKHGYAFKGKFFANEGRYVLLTPGNFNADGGVKLKGNKEKYYTGDFPDEYLMRRGEMLVVMTDLKQTAPILGSSAFIPEDGKFLHNQRLGRIVELDKSRMDRHFLYYLLNSYPVRSQIKATATGATVKHTAPDRIYAVEVSLPPLPTQRKIAAILSAYDDLIETNTRRIALLEQTAQLLYREWFVHFRFPGHDQIEMVDSELGVIPVGWKSHKLGDLIEIQKGKKAKTQYEESRDDSIPYLLINGLRAGKYLYTDDTKVRIAQKDDVIMVMDGASSALVFIGACGAVGSTLAYFRSRDQEMLSPYLLYMFLQYHYETISANNVGSAIPHANKDFIKGMDIALPPASLNRRFHNTVSLIYSQVENLKLRNINLHYTRDLLLPRLISGQLDVSELEILTGEFSQ